MSDAESAAPTVTTPALSRRRERLFRLFMIGFVLMFMIGGIMVAELTARYRERHRDPPSDYFPSIYYPHRRLRYGLVPNVDYYGWFKINSMGFRGREVPQHKPAGTFRIVCLGGSTTFDSGSVGKAKPWPEVMEDELRRRLASQSIDVLNLGIGGAMSLDSLVDMQMRAIGLEPDLVIVYQAHNDLIYSIPPPHKENTGLFPLEDRPRSQFIRWLTYNSLLYAKSEERVFGAISGIGNRIGSAVGLLRPEPGDDRNEGMETGLANFRSNILSTAAIAHANGIPLALVQVTVPFAEGPNGECQQCDALPETYGNVPLEKLRGMFTRYNDTLAQIAASNPGVYHVPTAGFVPAADRYYHDPVHFNPEGSVALGTKLADAIAPIVAQLRHE